MTYISYNKLWESDFRNIVLRKDKLQDLFSSQLELQVHDSYEGDEKITLKFEPVNNEDVINKTYLDEKCEKKDGRLSSLEKNENEFKLLGNKQPIEEVLLQRAVNTTIQILYDRG